MSQSSDFSGRWIGSIQGTNIATFTLVLSQADTVLQGDLSLNDEALGWAKFGVQGTAGDVVAEFQLTPLEAAPGVALSEGSARAALQPDGSLAGIWQMKSQTFGAFIAKRQIEPAELAERSREATSSRERARKVHAEISQSPHRWMPIMGEFEISTDSLLFKGRRIPTVATPPQPEGPQFMAAVGIALCDRKMANGTITATVTFDEVSSFSVCELVVSHDLRTKGQVTAGLGGSQAMFSIREWDPAAQTPQQTGGSWVNYELTGNRENLRGGTPYQLTVRVEGSVITLEVDGVGVGAATLAVAPKQAQQIGVFVVSEHPVHIANFRADVERPSAFIVMQFSSPYNEVYSDVIKQLCVEAGIDAIRADEIYGTRYHNQGRCRPYFQVTHHNRRYITNKSERVF